MLLLYSLLSLFILGYTDLVDVACQRNSSLPFCSTVVLRRKEAASPDDPFEKKFLPASPEDEEDEADTSIEETTTNRPRSTTPIPLPRQNMLYTVFPTLQKEKDWRRYCPVNRYTFQTTCLPGKRLRYDLQVFCQEFSEMCGVPNINLFPSRHTNPADEGRPKGYGQKQKNGQIGLGRSFGFGLGAIPGFEVITSQGADIGNGNMPFFNQIGGMILNQGIEVGALGHRIGKGPARSMNSLTHGFPSFGIGSGPNKGDMKLSQEVLKSFGVPNLPGLNKVLAKLGGNRPNRRVPGYEPGYGAVNPHAPIAIGKVDLDIFNLAGGFGDVEVEKGGGFGIGK